MLQTLKLLLPALIPSWRFFDVITPSPRIEFAVLGNREEEAVDWREFRPRLARLSLKQMVVHLFYNPQWNESLFLVSCAERLVNASTEHSQLEIVSRLRKGIAPPGKPYLQFRLVFVHRAGAEIKKEVWFVSPVFAHDA